MASTGMNAITRSGYRVEIDGLTGGDFMAVEALETGTTIIEYRIAGDPTPYKIPGAHSCSNVEMTRAWTGNRELWAWRGSVLIGQTERRSGVILVLDAAGGEISRIAFFRGWPCRWRLGPWRADAPEVLVETVELAVEGIELI